MTRDELLAAQREASVSLARTALANPFIYPEANRLTSARRRLAQAQQELAAAQAAWDRLIAPAKGWAPDPLKETPHD